MAIFIYIIYLKNMCLFLSFSTVYFIQKTKFKMFYFKTKYYGCLKIKFYCTHYLYVVYALTAFTLESDLSNPDNLLLN